MRKIIGIVGILSLALGIWALFLSLDATFAGGQRFAFASLDNFFATTFGDSYRALPGGVHSAFGNLSAFFTLSVLGIGLLWWGTRPKRRKFFRS